MALWVEMARDQIDAEVREEPGAFVVGWKVASKDGRSSTIGELSRG